MKNIRLLVMDVDGTLTDGRIYMGNDGELCKAFSIRDGCGIHDILMPAGITPVIITGRRSKILENRCGELGITELYQGVSDKVGRLNELLAEKGLTLSDCAYIGDDINDLPCMNAIKGRGFVGAPADAVQKVLDTADFISSKNGGDGAVRDFIEWLVY